MDSTEFIKLTDPDGFLISNDIISTIFADLDVVEV